MEDIINENNLPVKSDIDRWAAEKTYDFAKLMSYYKCAMMEVETKFKVLSEEFSLQYDRQPICSIRARLKCPDSIFEKLRRKNMSLTMTNIERGLSDVAGVRVVCSFKDDVYKLANAFLKQDDINLVRRKDYIARPKDNGYRSLHLIVSVPIYLEKEKRIMRVEVQLRTLSMDSWASLEHQLKYKKSTVFNTDMEEYLKECAEISENFDDHMDYLRSCVYYPGYDEDFSPGAELAVTDTDDSAGETENDW